MPAADFHPAAIVVTYYPDASALEKLLQRIAPQVDKTFIVDNTPGGFDSRGTIPGNMPVSLIALGENRGVAAAQNAGIAKAKENGFSHVLLLDQDSLPAEGMVSVLRDYLEELEREGLKVGAIGPKHVDARTGRPRGFATSRRGRFTRVKKSGTSWIHCDYLTTSGTMIPMEVLDIVGVMEAGLFIDGVDIEWGYRAASRGLNLVGVFETDLKHSKGERGLSLLGFRQTLYAPIRHYYAFRNFLTLARRPYISRAWKRHVLFTSPLYALMLTAFISPRLKNLRMIARGLSDGLKRRLGPIA